jgi:hypothetical protein
MNPGSREAHQNGCRCPQIDNHHGAGIGTPETGPVFIYDDRCPLPEHRKAVEEQIVLANEVIAEIVAEEQEQAQAALPHSVLDMLARRPQCIAEGVCVDCGGSAGPFRDALSKKEHGISGLCQKCQDAVFGVEEDV